MSSWSTTARLLQPWCRTGTPLALPRKPCCAAIRLIRSTGATQGADPPRCAGDASSCLLGPKRGTSGRSEPQRAVPAGRSYPPHGEKSRMPVLVRGPGSASKVLDARLGDPGARSAPKRLSETDTRRPRSAARERHEAADLVKPGWS
jgi:hypothetical protein